MARSVEDSLVVRMEASLRKFERQMERGRKAANTAAVGSERAWKRAGDQIAANANRATTGISRLSKISGSGRFVLQNTANQIGDMAVQLEGGTNAMRVMGQQLPQVLGGFGALGGALGVVAPLLGTVAAVGLPLAAMFLMTSDNADDASEKVKTFADKLSEAEAALRNAEAAMELASEGGLDDLQEKYGIVTERVRELAEALAEIETRAAQVKIGQVLDDALGDAYQRQLDRVFGTVGRAIAQAGTAEAQQEVEQIREAIRGLQAEIAIFEASGQAIPAALTSQLAEMRSELAALEGRVQDIGALAGDLIVSPETLSRISELQAQLQAAREAGDFTAMADTLNEMRNILEGTGAEIEQGVLDALTRAEDMARQMADALGVGETSADDLAAAASGIAGAISPAVAEAWNLVTALESGARAASAMSVAKSVGGRILDGIKTYGGILMDAAENPVAPRTSVRPRLPSVDASFGNDSSSSGRGSGRGGSGGVAKPDLFANAEKQIETLKRQIEMVGKTSDQVAELTAKYKLLDEAKERGLDLDAKQAATGETIRQQIDRQAKAIGNLTREKEQAAQRAAEFNRLQDDMKDGFIDAIIEGENFAGVMESVAKSLAKAALQAALFGEGPMAGLFGGGGGLLGGLFKGFKFAAGTAFAPGGAALVGERGPEIVNLPRGSQVYSAEKSRGMIGGGTITVVARVENGSIVQDVQRIAGDIAVQVTSEGISRYDRQTLPGSVERINRDPKRRG